MKGHTPRKRFGQHFLHDAQIINRIIDCAPADTKQRIVEIGPGLGALTKPLLKKYSRLELIELDKDLITFLHKELDDPSLQIHACDILKFDFSCYAPDKIFVIGNLPYNISTPVIFHLLDAVEYIEGMLFMLQKEVVERICADNGHKNYGRLSVMIQAQCQVKKQFDVKPGAFSPPPKVDSSIVSITPDISRKKGILDQSIFAAIVRAAFNQRRKKITNSLATLVGKTELEQAEIPADYRAEQLSVEQYITLANQVASINTRLS